MAEGIPRLRVLLLIIGSVACKDVEVGLLGPAVGTLPTTLQKVRRQQRRGRCSPTARRPHGSPPQASVGGGRYPPSAAAAPWRSPSRFPSRGGTSPRGRSRGAMPNSTERASLPGGPHHPNGRRRVRPDVDEQPHDPPGGGGGALDGAEQRGGPTERIARVDVRFPSGGSGSWRVLGVAQQAPHRGLTSHRDGRVQGIPVQIDQADARQCPPSGPPRERCGLGRAVAALDPAPPYQLMYSVCIGLKP